MLLLATLVLLCGAGVSPVHASSSSSSSNPLHSPLEEGSHSCDVQTVQEANAAQLHSILSELANTTYFRLFRVNLDQKCKFWKNGENGSSSGSESDDDDNDELCPSQAPGGLFGEPEAEAVPSCSLTFDDDPFASGIGALLSDTQVRVGVWACVGFEAWV